MSPKLGTPFVASASPGMFEPNRCASTADGNDAISLNAMGVQPIGSHASDAASTPEQTDR
jgi:hypothetical protein